MKLAAKLTLAGTTVIAAGVLLQAAVSRLLAGADQSSSPLSQLTAAVIVLALCGGLVYLVATYLIARPTRALIHQARRIATGDFSAAPRITQTDEIGELAREMNAMAGRLASADTESRSEHHERTAALAQLRHADRLSTVGKLASGIAHELGTPLNVVSGRATMIAGDRGATPTIVDSAHAISAQAHQMARIIHQLLGFARRRGLSTSDTNVRDVLTRARLLVRPLADKQDVSIVLSDQSDIVAHIDSGKVLQVVTNLIMNGIQAMPEGGTLTLGVHREHVDKPGDPCAAPGAYVCLTVADEGIGIATETLEHIFEPFFTTKDAEEGTGIGLSVCHGIVREHGGWIEVESQPGEGTTFAVFLPVEGDK